MVQQILIAIVLAALFYSGFLVIKNTYFRQDIQGVEETFIAPAPAVSQPIPEPPRTVAPGGPNSPSAMAPPDMPAIRVGAPGSSDPYDETYGSSQMEDNLRHPERLFGPASSPKETASAEGSGVASQNVEVGQALQTFSPDFAQNGGEFLDGGIFANDTLSDANYSSF